MYSDTFITLGQIFKSAADGSDSGFGTYVSALNDAVIPAMGANGWFSSDFVKMQFQSLAEMLRGDSVMAFSKKYSLDNVPLSNKKVKIIAAGNIPLVCFHDIFCVLSAGLRLVLKPSSKDKVLPMTVLGILKNLSPELGSRIEVEDDQRIEFDAIIATGSNNSGRYFDYYFAKYPHIIRRNRSSVAVLSGNESEEDYRLLAEDVFAYYGLGCRSVSKIFVPKGYDYDVFFKNIFFKSSVISNAKYSDNYTYNKAVYLMGGEKFLDNGFLLLKTDSSLSSPVAVLFCEEYQSLQDLGCYLAQNTESLQCVVSKADIKGVKTVPLGQSQHPSIFDFADGVDTIEFLKTL